MNVELLDEVLDPLSRIDPTEHLYCLAMGFQDLYRYSLGGALIIGGPLEEGCRKLYSEDLQGGQWIEGLTIVDPFRGSPTLCGRS